MHGQVFLLQIVHWSGLAVHSRLAWEKILQRPITMKYKFPISDKKMEIIFWKNCDDTRGIVLILDSFFLIKTNISYKFILHKYVNNLGTLLSQTYLAIKKIDLFYHIIVFYHPTKFLVNRHQYHRIQKFGVPKKNLKRA